MENDKQWIVVVYQAGNNNLSEEMVYALQEMRNIGTTEDFKQRAQVLSVFDPRGIEPRLYNFSQDVIRVENADGDLESFKDPRSFVQELFKQVRSIQRIGEKDIEDFKDFRERIFNNLDPDKLIRNLIQLLPIHETINRKTAYTMLVLSGHGSGPVGDFLPGKELEGRNIETSLTIPMLGEALTVITAWAAKKKIDILGMDSCLMSNMEVAYEVSGSADFLVGAEGFERNIGWPYHRVLEAILKTTPEPKDFAQTIVEKYSDFYRDYEVAGVSTDLSATHLTDFRKKIKPVIESLAKQLTNGLKVPEIQEAIVLAHWEAQGYKADEFVDLYDFCDRLMIGCQRVVERYKSLKGPAQKTVNNTWTKLREACRKVKNVIADGPRKVVLKSCFTGAAFQHSHGLSVYFPWSKFPDPLADEPEDPLEMPSSKVLEDYKKVLFAVETGWAYFLEEYLDATRRDRRNQKLHKNDRPERFGPADDSLSSVRTGSLSGRTGSLSGRTGSLSGRVPGELGTMKNPPDGFYPAKCAK